MSFVADSGGWDSSAAGGGDNWGSGPAAGGWNEAQGDDTWGQNHASDNFDGGHADLGGSNKENDANLGADDEKRGCFNCGENGHMKADCPHPRKFTGACRNCNEEGHMSKDCPNPRKLACRNCNEEGHRSSDCPERGPIVCRNCNEEGHIAKSCPSRGPIVCRNCNQEDHVTKDCGNARVIDRSHVPDATPDDAWNELMKAIKDRDMDDVKDAIGKYSKACPEMTFLQLQEGIFDSGLSLFLIAMERPLLPTYTNMDLQGNLNKKYSISYRFSDKPRRPKEAEGWPETRKEILSRLNDAGTVVENHIPYCSNCSVMGHTRRGCPQEGMGEVEQSGPSILCINCNATGHRSRDSPGHKTSECSEPRTAANIDCRKCGKTGHFARDCTQGGGGEKDKSNNLYGKRPDPKGDEANDSQLVSASNSMSADDGGWSQATSAGDGGWNASASGGRDW